MKIFVNALENFLVLYGQIIGLSEIQILEDDSKKLDIVLAVNSSHSPKEYYDITFFNDQAEKFNRLLEPSNRVTISSHLEKLENDELILIGDQFIPHEYTKAISKDIND